MFLFGVAVLFDFTLSLVVPLAGVRETTILAYAASDEEVTVDWEDFSDAHEYLCVISVRRDVCDTDTHSGGHGTAPGINWLAVEGIET